MEEIIKGIPSGIDEIWMSEIFYAGGTAEKNISANDLISDIKQTGKNAFFVDNRNDFIRCSPFSFYWQLCLTANGRKGSFPWNSLQNRCGKNCISAIIFLSLPFS